MNVRNVGAVAALSILILGVVFTFSGVPAASSSEATRVIAEGFQSAAPGVGNGPDWWPADLALPAAAVYQGESRRVAVWQSAILDLDSAASQASQMAKRAGYHLFTAHAGQDQSYALFVTKDGKAFRLTLNQIPGGIKVEGRPVGVIRIKASGQANAEFDLPMTGVPYLAVEDLFQVHSQAPSGECEGCAYVFTLSVSPYRRPGAYTTTDVTINLGGLTPDRDYRSVQACNVTVKDTSGGTFHCSRLQNMADKSKTLSVSGSWQIP